jgi:hypothetical protein
MTGRRGGEGGGGAVGQRSGQVLTSVIDWDLASLTASLESLDPPLMRRCAAGHGPLGTW